MYILTNNSYYTLGKGKSNWTLTFTLHGATLVNYNGDVVKPECFTTCTIKCTDGVISQILGNSASASEERSQSNEVKVNAYDFNLTME